MFGPVEIVARGVAQVAMRVDVQWSLVDLVLEHRRAWTREEREVVAVLEDVERELEECPGSKKLLDHKRELVAQLPERPWWIGHAPFELVALEIEGVAFGAVQATTYRWTEMLWRPGLVTMRWQSGLTWACDLRGRLVRGEPSFA